ncbi:hypothetical protein T439DRAFT_382507 [Meredithblackwellia eburnea MCA 4105]
MSETPTPNSIKERAGYAIFQLVYYYGSFCDNESILVSGQLRPHRSRASRSSPPGESADAAAILEGLLHFNVAWLLSRLCNMRRRCNVADEEYLGKFSRELDSFDDDICLAFFGERKCHVGELLPVRDQYLEDVPAVHRLDSSGNCPYRFVEEQNGFKLFAEPRYTEMMAFKILKVGIKQLFQVLNHEPRFSTLRFSAGGHILSSNGQRNNLLKLLLAVEELFKGDKNLIGVSQLPELASKHAQNLRQLLQIIRGLPDLMGAWVEDNFNPLPYPNHDPDAEGGDWQYEQFLDILGGMYMITWACVIAWVLSFFTRSIGGPATKRLADEILQKYSTEKEKEDTPEYEEVQGAKKRLPAFMARWILKQTFTDKSFLNVPPGANLDNFGTQPRSRLRYHHPSRTWIELPQHSLGTLSLRQAGRLARARAQVGLFD